MGWLGCTSLASGPRAEPHPLGFAASWGSHRLLANDGTALGAKVRSVHEVRRSFRQSLWLCLMLTVPLWLSLWNCRKHASWPWDRSRGWRATPRSSSRAICGRCRCPRCCSAAHAQLPRLGRAAWLRRDQRRGDRPQRAARLGTDSSDALGFPRWAFSAAGLQVRSSGPCSRWRLAVIPGDRQFRRFHLFGHLWKSDWPRFWRMIHLGVPIGLAFAFEGARCSEPRPISWG